jgi:hypothetical protein
MTRVEIVMGSYRFNIIDKSGIASFLGPRHGSKMIAAACGANHRTLDSVLTYISALDDVWARQIRDGLRAFDSSGTHDHGRASEPFPIANEIEAFRVVDTETRAKSMSISSLGLFVVNLKEKRIVQVDNRSIELHKAGRGRVRRNGKPTKMLFRYALPHEWDLVP